MGAQGGAGQSARALPGLYANEGVVVGEIREVFRLRKRVLLKLVPHLPVACLRVVASALFVVLGALTLGLVFREDANPDADVFSVWHLRREGFARSPLP